MRLHKHPWLVAVAMLLATFGASAQYYQVANQATQMLSAALRGGLNYRGFVDAGYLQGIGGRKANILEVTTTHGFKYKEWFFMGMGAGVNVLFSDAVSQPSMVPEKKDYCTTGVMIPLYTDFRFNLGKPTSTSAYIDVRVGASFLAGNKYLRVGDGYLTSNESFYLKPTIGMRIPVSSTNSKYAVNLGVSYQLLTNNYWYGSNTSTTLNALGLTVGFEW